MFIKEGGQCWLFLTWATASSRSLCASIPSHRATGSVGADQVMPIPLCGYPRSSITLAPQRSVMVSPGPMLRKGRWLTVARRTQQH